MAEKDSKKKDKKVRCEAQGEEDEDRPRKSKKQAKVEEEEEEEQEERPRKDKKKKDKDEAVPEELPSKEKKKKKKCEDEELEEEQPRKSKKRAVTEDLEDDAEAEKQARKAARKAERLSTQEIDEEGIYVKTSKKRATAEEAIGSVEDEDELPKGKKKAKKNESDDEVKQEDEIEADDDSQEKPAPKEYKIKVRGLPKILSEEAIRKHFEMCGAVADVNLLRRPNGKSCGTAFVRFERKSGLKSALEGVGKVYEGQALQVEKSEGTERKSDAGRNFEVFVGGLPYAANEKSLRQDFGECGDIQGVNFNPRGFAFITFQTQEGMRKALELNETEYHGRWLQVKVAGQGKSKGKGAEDEGQGQRGKGKGKGKSKGSREDVPETQEDAVPAKGKSKDKKGKGKGAEDKGDGGTRAFEIFVGGLPFDVDEETVRKDFMACGEMGRFSMPYHEWGPHQGAHQGLAFVNFLNEESMQKALAFHETEYHGVWIRVLKADAPRNPGARS